MCGAKNLDAKRTLIGRRFHPRVGYPHCRLKCRLQGRRHLLSWFQQRRKIHSAYPILSHSYSYGDYHDLVKSEENLHPLRLRVVDVGGRGGNQ
jgi:hypothetical protein